MPPHLYKYRGLSDETDLERLLKSALDGTFMASSASTFNDPFDCSPRFVRNATDDELMAYHLRSLGPGHDPERIKRGSGRAWVSAFRAGSKYTETVLSEREESFRRYLTRKWGVLCVAENFDCLLMWGHYAGSHGGACIEIATDHLPEGEVFQKVDYVSDRPTMNMITANHTDESHVEDMMRRCLLTKAAPWHYEREWRCLEPGGAQLMTFGRDAVSSVTFGARANYPLMKKAIRALRWARPTLPLYRAKLSRDSFSVERHRL